MRAGDRGVVQGWSPKGMAVRISERRTGIDPDLVCQPLEERRAGEVEAPSPADTAINTLPVYGNSAGTQGDKRTE